jgi:hypothetical protein
MVQPPMSDLKLRERVIAITPKCATIGTVQKVLKRPTEPGLSRGPEVVFQGPTSGNQVVGKQVSDAGRNTLRLKRVIAKTRR